MGCTLPVRASTSCSSVHCNRSSPSWANFLGSVSPSAKACRMRSPLAPSKLLTTIDSLMRISSSRHSIWFCSRTRSRVELHLHAGEAAPNTLFPVGHKTQYQLIGDQPPHQPLGIFEVMLAPPRCTVGERLRQLQTHMGLQLQPHRPPVLSGRFHDCLLHPCSCNQIRHRCNSLGSVTNRRRAGFSSGTLASTTTTIKTFLCTSIPAIFIASSWRGSGRTHAK